MFKITAIALLALSASTSVFAADAVQQIPQAPAAVEIAPFSWSGAYVGIQGGGGWLDADFSTGFGSATEDFNGGIFGGFVGYNWQFSNGFVLGIEGDADYNWNEQDDLFGLPGLEAGTEWSGSVRGRLGYAFDRALIYGAGGWTATRAYLETPFDKESETFSGWTIGAGVDYAVTDNVFIRGEYRYNNFGDKEIAPGLNVDLDQHVVKAGIAIKF